MAVFGVYDWPFTRFKTWVGGSELSIAFPYEAPTQEIAWLLDAIYPPSMLPSYGSLVPLDSLVPSDSLVPF